MGSLEGVVVYPHYVVVVVISMRLIEIGIEVKAKCKLNTQQNTQ